LSVRYSKYIPAISVIGDLLILNSCFVFAFCFYFDSSGNCFSPANLSLYIYLNIVWIILGSIFKIYGEFRKLEIKKLLISNTSAVVFFFFLFLIFFQLVAIESYYQRDQIKYVFIFFTFFIFSWRLVLYYSFLLYRKSGYNYRNVIILGYNDNVRELMNYFNANPLSGYRLMGLFCHQEVAHNIQSGSYQDVTAFIEKNDIDEVYIAINDIPKSQHDLIFKIINTFAIKIRFIPELAGFSHLNIQLVNYDEVPVIQVNQGPLSRWYNRFLKRGFDIIISLLILLLILSWLIPVLFLINKLTSGGKLFFIQKRSGLNNKTFNCIKFRSLEDDPEDEAKQVTEQDKRVTRLGKWLRKSNIDELPQVINVLLNQMSAVGPRPHMLAHTSEFKKVIDKFMVRHLVKPGITGLAQVRGYRGEIKNRSDLEKRVQLDLSYIENWTLFLDIKIIFLTIWNMIKGDKKAY